MPGRRLRLSKKGLHEDARRLRSVPTGNGGGVTPHPLLGPFHSDTDIASPAEGALVLSDATPEWNILLHPAAAGYAMVTDATTWTIDQTPTWTGDHTWDDGDGDSPAIHLIPENDDDWQIWAEDNATPGDSNLIVKFPAADTDSYFIWRDSGDNDVAWVNADGHTTWDGVAHRFGVEDTAAAIVTISGDAAGDEGGQFNLELSGAHDGVFNEWIIDVFQDDFRFLRGDAGVINMMTAEGLLSLSVAGAAGGVQIGGDAQWYRSAANVMATPDDLYLAGAGLGIIHVDGVAAGAILVANGTRYVPGTIADAGGAPNDAQYVVMALDGDLSAERVLTAGDGIALADGGANGNATLAVDLVAAWSGLEFNGGDLRIDLDATFNAWTGVHTHTANIVLDDGAGNSPFLVLVGGTNDDLGILYLVDDAVGDDSDVALALCAVDAGSQFQIQTSGFATVAWIDATGDASFEDIYIATGKGIIHADGVAAGWLLVANGTRYVPANPAASLPIAPGARGHIIRAEAGPAWASYNANTLGAVLIGDGTDIISDTTPTLVGDLTLDKNGGNSPLLHFITVSNDEIKLLADDTNGDFRILLSEAAGVSSLLVEDSAGAQQFAVTSDGDTAITGSLTVPQYIIHAVDPDTYIEFAPDEIALWAGASALLTITEAATNTILFGAQADLNGNDLIIDTDGNTFLHASADNVVQLVIESNAQYQLDATQLTISTTVPAAVLYLRTAGDVQSTSADIYEANALGLAAANSVHVFVDANDGGTDAYFAVHMDAENLDDVDISELWRVTETNEMMMRRDGIAHGGTDIVRTTDTFFQVSNVDSSAGGALVTGARDSQGGAGGGAMVVRGALDDGTDTAKSAAARGIIETYSGQISGTDWDDVDANGNIVVFRTRASAAWATRFIFDTEGSAHAEVEWVAFDEHDDVALLDALESSFGEFAEDHQADLERLKIATYDGTPGHAMVNFSRLAMLHTGAIRQMSQRLGRYEKALLELGANPALLKA